MDKWKGKMCRLKLNTLASVWTIETKLNSNMNCTLAPGCLSVTKWLILKPWSDYSTHHCHPPYYYHTMLRMCIDYVQSRDEICLGTTVCYYFRMCTVVHIILLAIILTRLKQQFNKTKVRRKLQVSPEVIEAKKIKNEYNNTIRKKKSQLALKFKSLQIQFKKMILWSVNTFF